MSSPVSAEPPKSRGLLRILGVGFGLAVAIGNTIGAGILRTPGDIAHWLPRTWMFIGIWVVGGLYALVGSFSMSELAAMLPRSGGYYVFARRAFGEYLGFVVGWTDFLAQCGSTGAVSIVIGEYSGDLFPLLAGHKVLVACTASTVIALLQWRGIKWGSLFQNLSSAAKALAFAILIAAIFFFAHPQAHANNAPVATGAGFLVLLILALQSVIYTYDGWYGVIYFGEEVKDPGRDIPRATIGSVLSIATIYILINCALAYAVALPDIAGKDMAVGIAAERVLAHGDTFIRVLMLISMVSCLNAFHLMASRIVFAMANDGLLFHQAARANKGGTPTLGLLFSAIASVLFISTGSFEKVVAIMAFFFVADYAIAYLGVIVLRRREPELPRPYRAWGYPWTTGLVLAGSIAFLIGAIAGDWKNSVWALGVLALSVPLYFLTRFLRARA